MADIPARLKLRTGTLAAWTSANPVLAAGEPGFESDTQTLRIGDGVTAFLSLPRIRTIDGFVATFQPLSDSLTAFSGLGITTDQIAYGTGIGTMAVTALTSEARTFLSALTKTQQRTSLELLSGATTAVSNDTNLATNPTQIPTRGAVSAAILAVGGPAKRIVYTASSTFVKADHGPYPNDHLVLLKGWSAGGGGNTDPSGAGGGGGRAKSRLVRWADLPATMPITIGAGGAQGNPASAGGTTSIGTLLSVPGGNGASGGASGSTGGAGAGPGGGAGGVSTGPGGAATSDEGGGGGGGGVSFGATAGGSAFEGGGGGGGGGGGVGGASQFAGKGGNSGVAGSAPSGGGGRNAPGARGQAEIIL